MVTANTVSRTMASCSEAAMRKVFHKSQPRLVSRNGLPEGGGEVRGGAAGGEGGMPRAVRSATVIELGERKAGRDCFRAMEGLMQGTAARIRRTIAPGRTASHHHLPAARRRPRLRGLLAL